MSNQKLTDNMDLNETPYSKHKSMILDTAIDIHENDAREAKQIGYGARALIMATLPHRDPKTNFYERVNGGYKLSILAPPNVGIPYGVIPRLVMIYLTKRCIETKNREIKLGDNLSEFMKELGLNVTGGKYGTITSLRKQIKRLFKCTISFEYSDKKTDYGRNIYIADEYYLFWEDSNDIETPKNTVILGERLFNEIVNHKVPIDLRAIKCLRRSALALDIYMWSTWRVYSIKKPTLISWGDLRIQFGSDYSDTAKGKYTFKRNFVEQLSKVKAVYPKLDAFPGEDGLILSPSPTHVPKRFPKSNKKVLPRKR
ncbi:MAG: pirin [Proteobacteria bacterium]|nr:pirin [Pseudomonadota bacterium]